MTQQTKIVAYSAIITETNGGREYTNNVIILYDTYKARKKFARDWRNSLESNWDEQEQGYWSDDAIIHLPICMRPLTQTDLNLYHQSCDLFTQATGDPQ